MSLNPTCECKILFGAHLYIPKIMESDNCGVSQKWEQNKNILDWNSCDQPDEDNVMLQLLVDKAFQEQKTDKNKSQVFEECFGYYPLEKAPHKAPMIYERDKLKDTEQKKWTSRIQMFETAYKSDNIFVISIVPSNPKECQTWYQKRILKSSNPDLLPESSELEHKQSFCLSPRKEGKIPLKQLGFLKPFETFSSQNYEADPIFEKIEASWIGSSEEIEKSLNDIKKVQLKEQMKMILTHFIADEQTKSVGITFRDGDKAGFKLFHKIV